MEINKYKQRLEKMFALRRFGIKLGLETIETILNSIGNPQHNFKSIHIAGTNGKGSVAAMLSTILIASGYCVGRYTSPHLVHFNERICIDNKPIGNDDVISANDKVQSVQNLSREPTFFEFTTAMALYEFSRRRVDWAVIETGMGGRLDATNIITPEISIITNISLEHKSYLGKTISTIAREKAGIIKPHTPVVTGVTQKSAKNKISESATKQKAPLILKGRDFRCRRENPKQFSYYGIDHTWYNIKLNLAGTHQIENASLALACCEMLERTGIAKIPLGAIHRGLATTSWPGRLEVVSKTPHLVLDGAHNLMAARVLSRYLREQYHNRKIQLVIGILDDKPFESILKELSVPCSQVIITQPKIDRAVSVNRLANIAKKFFSEHIIIPDVKQAIIYAIQNSTPDDVICVAGSLYVVGEAKSALEKSKIILTTQNKI